MLDGIAIASGLGVGLILGITVVALALLLGVLVSLSSIGATLILLIYPRMPARDIFGTGIDHASLGHVDRELLVPRLIGSRPGNWLGAQLTRRLPDGVVRSLFCVSPLMAGWKVIQ